MTTGAPAEAGLPAERRRLTRNDRSREAAGRDRSRRMLDTSAVSKPVSQLHFLDRADDQTVHEVHRVVSAVVELGGAVGWLSPPSRADIHRWLGEWRTATATGRAGFALCRVDGQVEALGGWRAGPPGPMGHVVDLTKIMVHPRARGLGLGRTVMDALIGRAGGYGAELLTLGVRGNNHGAQALYEACGFTVWGVLPNGVAVGDHRFDVIRMYRQLRLPADAVIHGSSDGGIGGSALRLASAVPTAR